MAPKKDSKGLDQTKPRPTAVKTATKAEANALMASSATSGRMGFQPIEDAQMM